MFYKALAIAATVSVILLSGCATSKNMPLSDDSDSSVLTGKAIYLMTATIKNSYRTSHQPKLITVNVEKDAGTNKSDRLNFKNDDQGTTESDTAEGSTYLLRMELDQGEYVLQGLSCMSSSFPVHGYFFVPIHANIASKGAGVFYLGHIEANVRERQGNEFKAGSVIPLIDQAIAGASTGTFDVEISDRWTTDQGKFTENFPVLANTPIQMAILPPFDRAKAQQWWEAH